MQCSPTSMRNSTSNSLIGTKPRSKTSSGSKQRRDGMRVTSPRGLRKAGAVEQAPALPGSPCTTASSCTHLTNGKQSRPSNGMPNRKGMRQLGASTSAGSMPRGSDCSRHAIIVRWRTNRILDWGGEAAPQQNPSFLLIDILIDSYYLYRITKE